MEEKRKPTQEHLAYIDDLTGIYNRRYLKKTQIEIEEFREKNIPFSVVIVDIDHFKDINDTYGHMKGDEVIKDFSQFLKDTLRASDTVVRYGGDEFVCIMSSADRDDTRQIYSRILERCKKRKFGGVDVMISAGIASFPTDCEDFEELLKIADESLYDAKRSGRGRIGSTRKKRIDLPTQVCVGRRWEKEALKRFITKEDGGIRAVIIEGTVGVGKTRLVKEVLNNISGMEILWSDCLAFFEGIPYYPISEIIRYKIKRQGKRIIEEIPLAYRIEIGKLIPEVMEEIKEKVDEIGLVLDKYRLYESVRRIIETGVRKKVIIIDNMQWSDRETTESIKYLLRSLKKHPIAFLFIYRQEEKTNFLEDFTSYISRETEVKEIKVDPFERNMIKEMVDFIIGEKSAKELVEYIEQGSGGNPLYIEELIKGLNDGGYLRVEGEKWHFERPSAEIIPKSIEDITERKYQTLSKEAKEIIEIASVIGWFDIDIIKAITGYNEGHIIGMIENMRRLGLIKERGERVEFQEEISRDAVYKRHVSAIKGRMFHKRVGERLEERYGGKESEVIEELAFHYYRALDKDKGVRYCVEAGDQAKEKYANSIAIRFYTWAEELLKEQRDEDKMKMGIDVLSKRADVLSFIGDNEGAIKDLESGLEFAKKIGDKKIEVDLYFKKASVYINIAQHTKAIEEADKCIKIYKEMGDKKGVAKVMNAIGNTLGFLGEYEKAFENYKDSLKICREIGDINFEARLLNNMGIVYMNLEDYDKALQYLKASLKIKGEVGDKYIKGAALNNIGLIYMYSGWYNKALTHYEDSLKIFREIGNKYGEALVLNNVGIVGCNWGDYNKGLKFSQDSLKIAIDTENKYSETLALNNIGNIYLNWGDYNKASKYFENSLRISESIKSNERTFKNLLSLGSLYVTMGKFGEAKGYIDKANKMARDLNSERMLRDVSSSLCEFYLDQKKFEQFMKTMEKLEDLSKKMKPKKLEGEINLLLGRYYTETNDFEKANKYLKDGLKIFEEMEERLSVGIVYYYIGTLESIKGNKSAAQKHINKSIEIFNSLGAKEWEEKTKQALLEAR